MPDWASRLPAMSLDGAYINQTDTMAVIEQRGPLGKRRSRALRASTPERLTNPSYRVPPGAEPQGPGYKQTSGSQYNPELQSGRSSKYSGRSETLQILIIMIVSLIGLVQNLLKILNALYVQTASIQFACRSIL